MIINWSLLYITTSLYHYTYHYIIIMIITPKSPGLRVIGGIPATRVIRDYRRYVIMHYVIMG